MVGGKLQGFHNIFKTNGTPILDYLEATLISSNNLSELISPKYAKSIALYLSNIRLISHMIT